MLNLKKYRPIVASAHSTIVFSERIHKEHSEAQPLTERSVSSCI